MLTATKRFFKRHKKYLPLLFFIGGFTWDSLTLGRIDGWYSNTVLFTYLLGLTASLYIFNLADDGRWKNTFLEPYQEYFPLAIQFFLGGLSSAYVIFFFQSVSFTKALVFFLILVALLISNELLKHRLSNKYLQFGAYFFVNLTFFTFFTPVIFATMNTFVFVVSGLVSLGLTLFFIYYMYQHSPSTRLEINRWKVISLVLGIYFFINTCYYFNLIPPVPLSLKTGMVAYNIEKDDSNFQVTYEKPAFYKFWQPHDHTFNYLSGDSVFIFTSIFAPTDLKKSVQHQWRWYNRKSGKWVTSDTISYTVLGGRQKGFRGYTVKENIWPGQWRVNVTTGNGLVLGQIDFKVIKDSTELSLTNKNF